MEIKKILWPTDLSHNSASALPFVAELGAKYGAQILLAYVAEDMSRYDHIYGDAEPEHLKALQELELKKAQEKMEKTCTSDLGGCPAYIHHVLKGEPAEEVLNLAESQGADLIVMASHGRHQSETSRKFFGSVTDKVVRNSSIPVLVVPGN